MEKKPFTIQEPGKEEQIKWLTQAEADELQARLLQYVAFNISTFMNCPILHFSLILFVKLDWKLFILILFQFREYNRKKAEELKRKAEEEANKKIPIISDEVNDCEGFYNATYFWVLNINRRMSNSSIYTILRPFLGFLSAWVISACFSARRTSLLL